ncbi:cobalt-factor II C20-methyltransferase [Prochlorococcus marinus str. MIT 9312]|uniref:Cobalt-factor II C20-methyltransferase n=1 Tax=Prochlorococcus marinus (strain MIT 9312) TaxID=74546 RepID=Q31CE9_PROM9|nr:precorrin-2 C(20)-methyltransferase [Prochlorococcus marinus]ABB49446.1 cobalt-factor II C20-methyltransferase [Prochlorococcus marinus str. MIT 9312]KGG00775.1 Cobalt-precorrin-2 C20-methyltransferase [Prochlorococcus marinus str. MIT 9311]
MLLKKILRVFTEYKSEATSLTIVGVGPGDSSLLTIAAVDAIKKAKVIVFPVSDDNKKSFAAEIVKKYTKFKKNIPIIFPMARKDFDPDEIWTNAVEKIVKFINNGEPVVLLCLGDTSLFASSSYILRIIKNNYPKIIIRTIPGISSISAAAALNNFDLVKKGETLIIKECPSSNLELTSLIMESRGNKIVLALMKVGKRWKLVRETLKKEEIINQSLVALNVGMPYQIIQYASQYKEDVMPYFSLILIRSD